MTTAIEVNCATGEVIERPLTADEIAAQAQAEVNRLAAEAEAAIKAEAKTALLAKLGITAEEAALLLG
jgi:F0F1-type ATP synthase membrane subunit b/b'